MRRFRAGEIAAGARADVFIASRYPQFSRSSLEKLFANGSVRLKNQPVKSSYKVRRGDLFSVKDEWLFHQPSVVKLPIIYQDADVLVINKPADMLTHSKGLINLEPTVASFIKP